MRSNPYSIMILVLLTLGYKPTVSSAPEEMQFSYGDMKCILPNRLQRLGPFSPMEYTFESINRSLEIESFIKSDRPDYFGIALWALEKWNRDLLSRWIALLCIRLRIYATEFPSGIMKDPIDYLLNSLKYGPAYAKYLKDLRANMFQLKLGTFNATPFHIKNRELYERDMTPTPVDGGCDYDQILNERYLIHYNEVSMDFYKYPFMKVKFVKRYHDTFRGKLREFLKTIKVPINAPSREEMRNWISDSTSMVSEVESSVNRTLMRKLARDDMSGLDRKESRFLRSVINVGPANCRDAWQCDIPTLFKVKRVSYILRQVVSRHRYSAMASEKIARRRRKILRDNDLYDFLLLDIKKCGLSMPRILFKIVAEELRHAGIAGADDLESIASGSVYCLNKEWKPERGSGLGNLNEAVTLIQCIIGDTAKHFGLIEDAIFFNDDSVMRIRHTENNKFSLPIMIDHYRKMGIIMNIEKSYLSKYNVFCEDYTAGKFDFSKRHLRCLQLSTFVEQTQIHEQKKILSSITRDLDVFAEGTVKINGQFEFHEFERILPSLLGGWKNTVVGGVNMILDYIFRPSIYLDKPEDRGLIPLMNKFISYILFNQEEFREIFCMKKRFRYRDEVKNPFNPTFTDLSLYDMTGIPDICIDNRYQDYEDLYNKRGLKNAKPKLKLNFAKYISQRRYSFFRDFWKKKDQIRNFIYESPISLWKIMSFLRSDDLLSKNLVPPAFLGIGGKADPMLRTTKQVIYSRSDCRGPVDDIKRVNTLLAWRFREIRPNLMTEPLTRLLSPRSEGYFTLKNGVIKCQFDVPDWYHLFFRDKSFFCSVWYSLYGRIPDQWYPWKPGVVDLSDLRLNIYGLLLGEEAQQLIERVDETPRLRSYFNYIVKDEKVDSIGKIQLAVDLAVELIDDKEEKFEATPLLDLYKEDLDIDLLYEFYEDLVIDYLAMEDELQQDDIIDVDSEVDDDDMSRLDAIDIISGLDHPYMDY